MKSLGKDPANMAKMLELAPKAMEIKSRLDAEMAKMTPEEKKAFEAKWQAKFNELGDGDSPF